MKAKNNITRRGFLKNIGVATSVLAFPSTIPAWVLGKNGAVAPSERIQVAYIGCGGISNTGNRPFTENPHCQVVAACDPIRDRRVAKQTLINEMIGKEKSIENYKGVREYNDFRDVLASPDVDAVYVATGDYWHVPISIAAAKAGKDMHTEKPLGLFIGQCLAMGRAVEKYNRVFQYGTEARSFIHPRMAIELVLNGHIGEVKEVYAWCPCGQSGGSATPVLPVPEGFDYDLWLGPAPKKPFCKDRCLNQGQRKGIFHIYDHAIGFLAGWGAHPIDMVQWWADKTGQGTPLEYEGTGTLPDSGLFNTIVNWDMTCRYRSGVTLQFMDVVSAKAKISKDEKLTWDNKWGHGVIFVGTKGEVYLQRMAFKTNPMTLMKVAKNPGDIRLPASSDHNANWIHCIKTREQPVSDVHSAVKSDILCHLCDISIRTGRKITWDPEKETIVDDPEAVRMMSRPMRGTL